MWQHAAAFSQHSAFLCAAALSTSELKITDIFREVLGSSGSFFLVTNYKLDGGRLVTCHPGNQENGGEACSAMSVSLADTNFMHFFVRHFYKIILLVSFSPYCVFGC